MIIRILESYDQTDYSNLSFDEFCDIVASHSDSSTGFSIAIEASDPDTLYRVYDSYDNWSKYLKDTGDSSRSGVMKYISTCIGTYSKFYTQVTEDNYRVLYSMDKFIEDLSRVSESATKEDIVEYISSHPEIYDEYSSQLIGSDVRSIPDVELLKSIANNIEKELLVNG